VANLVRTETMEKLKAAGWTDPMPDAQELADQLPEALNVIRHTGFWTATADRGMGRPVVSDAADSLAEALANLWIKISEA
jgi:hypothetical protein